VEKDGETSKQLQDEIRSLKERLAEMERIADGLRASERMYQTLLDAIDDGIHANDVEGRYLVVNEEMALRHGMSKEALLGKTPFDLYEPGIAQKAMDQYRHVMRTGEVLDEEMVYPGARAQCRHVHRAPLRGAASEITGVVTVSRDITARKQAEEALRRERDFSSAVVDTVGALLIVLDPDARIVRANRACERITGYSMAEIQGKPIWKVLCYPDGNGQGREAFLSTLSGHFPNSAENCLITRDGERRLIAWTNTAVLDCDGRVEYVIAVGADITEQRRAEEALQENNRLLTRWIDELERRNQETILINNMGDLLQSCVSFEEAYSVVAHSAPKLFPSTSGALFAISPSRNLVDAVATWGDFPESGRIFAPDECWGLRRGRVHTVDDLGSGLICHHLAQPLPASYLCVPMMAQGEILGSLHVRVNGASRPPETMTQLAVTVAEHAALALANLKLQQTLRDQAIHDLLTGLFNRRYMEEILERELLRAKRRGSSVGVIMVDIDHFKQFNDLYGHEAGDALLAAMGSYLRTHVRGEDVACRYGGDEIILILPDSSLEDTRSRAEQLREGIKSLGVEYRRQPLGTVTVSMGVAAFPLHGSDKERLLNASDLALYRAKSEGRDRVMVAP